MEAFKLLLKLTTSKRKKGGACVSDVLMSVKVNTKKYFCMYLCQFIS